MSFVGNEEFGHDSCKTVRIVIYFDDCRADYNVEDSEN